MVYSQPKHVRDDDDDNNNNNNNNNNKNCLKVHFVWLTLAIYL
jgi:hypothetical protein